MRYHSPLLKKILLIFLKCICMYICLCEIMCTMRVQVPTDARGHYINCPFKVWNMLSVCYFFLVWKKSERDLINATFPRVVDIYKLQSMEILCKVGIWIGFYMTSKPVLTVIPSFVWWVLECAPKLFRFNGDQVHVAWGKELGRQMTP